MAGQDRGDDAEPTNRDGAQAGPDTDPTAPLPENATGGAHPDQPLDAGQAAADPVPARPAPGAPPEPEPAGPGAPPAGPPRPATGPSGTSVLPPALGAPPPEPPRWAARAQVPTPRVEDYADEWVAAEPSRGLFVPVLVTVCLVLLAGVFGVAVWFMLDNRPQAVPSPTATPSGRATTMTTTTAPPTTTTTSATPTRIEVPPLTGETYEDAARALTELGLEPEREDVVSDAVPPGRVVGTNPTAGTRVSPGETVTVFVARETGPTATPSPTATATATPTPTAT